MAIIVNMPRLSDTMEEGTVASWLKKVGDKVEEGDIPYYQDRPGSKIHFFRDELDQWIKQKKRISKKEILDEADNLKFGNHGGK